MRFRNSHYIDLHYILSGLFSLLFAAVTFGGPRHLLEDALPDKMLSGHTDGVLAVDFFPDGTRIVSGAHDNTVRLWDISGRLLHTFRGHARAVCSVSVSPDGLRIASGSLDHAALVWDVKSGELIAQLLGHTGPVHVAFLPDGRLLTGGGDGTLRIWDVNAEKELWRSTPDQCVRVMTVTPDGHFAAYGACDSTLRVWDLNERKLIGKYGEFIDYSVDAVAITPDGRHVYRHVGVEGIKGWNVADGKPLELPASFSDAASIALSRDGTRMIDGSRSVVETESGRLIERYRNNSAEMPRAAVFSPDGRHFAIAGGGWGFDQNYT